MKVLLDRVWRFYTCSGEECKVTSPREEQFLLGDGCYLAGFKGQFPEVEQLAQKNKDLARYLFNNVKVCVQCLRACAYSQKACQACGTPLETVPVTQTENVLMGFIFGVEKTSKFPLVISLRRQSIDAIVYDDLLAMSSCHLNALPTNHYVADWIWLLRDPTGAKQLIDTLVQEAWEATRSFLDDAEWRRFIYKEGVTEEMIRQNIMCGFNSPPSQSQLHLQWIVLPLLPFHHQKLLDRTHAQKGRWFPLEYVLPILDYLEKENDFFDVNSTTTAEDVIQHFNGRASCTIASGSIAMPDTAAATPKWPTGIRRISASWFTKALFTTLLRCETGDMFAWENVWTWSQHRYKLRTSCDSKTMAGSTVKQDSQAEPTTSITRLQKLAPEVYTYGRAWSRRILCDAALHVPCLGTLGKSAYKKQFTRHAESYASRSPGHSFSPRAAD